VSRVCSIVAKCSQITGYVIIDYFTGKVVMAGGPAVCSDILQRVCYMPASSQG
jgi:hypothetical protein